MLPLQLTPFSKPSVKLHIPLTLSEENRTNKLSSHSCQELNAIAKLTRKKKLLLITILLLAVIGTVIYLLADRYLIEHVEITLTDQTSDSMASTKQAATAVKYDDWNYSSSKTNISIKKVEAGSGADQITYFVADIQLADAAGLQSAFADDSFGRNIIAYTSTIAEEKHAIFAINGDYYGFRNDGVIIRNGTLFRDEPTRDAMALLSDGTMQSYDEEELSSSDLLAEGALNTYSFGPVLVKDGEAVDDFTKISIDSNFGNRSIQDSNPRTGIGMIAPNHYLFIVVDGRKSNYSKGMTLTEFAKLFADLGATEAYNLDGGGSSTMYFMGRVVNNPLGKSKERGVSDILYIAD